VHERDELYTVARTVLLDALEALGEHRKALVLVGAQAIYLRVGEADLAVASYTTDGDLAIDPRILVEVPPLEQKLTEAGFKRNAKGDVGIWVARRPTATQRLLDVSVDLLVPTAFSPGDHPEKHRSARLPGHSKVARTVNGLEGVLVDQDALEISSFVGSDPRAFQIPVAGPAAMIMAKTFKIQDRLGSTRLSDKDALDVYRLLRGVPTDDLAARYRLILEDAIAGANGRASLGLLKGLFGDRRAQGVAMTLQASENLLDPEETATALVFLAQDLLDALG
jgi:hypothetical protein